MKYIRRYEKCTNIIPNALCDYFNKALLGLSKPLIYILHITQHTSYYYTINVLNNSFIEAYAILSLILQGPCELYILMTDV